MAVPSNVTCFVLRSLQRGKRGFSALKPCSFCTSSSVFTSSGEEGSGDPMPVFMQGEVQRLLRKMTGFNILKVAGPRKNPLNLKKPKYQLLTDEELAQLQKEADSKMTYRLQIPPFMKVRQPVRDLLSNDHDLTGLESSKYIFTDISFGVKDRQRVMVVREPDGTLRRADWEERDRINQIYSPVEGRQIETPKMFAEEQLETLLKDGKYVYILDSACVQFEPDHPDFIRVCHRSFEVIDTKRHYELLRSTRHFASMAFYLAWYKKVDYLLIDAINRELLSDAGDVIQLFCIIHPDSSIAQKLKSEPSKDVIATLKEFCHAEASHKGQLELSIQGYEEKVASSAAASS